MYLHSLRVVCVDRRSVETNETDQKNSSKINKNNNKLSVLSQYTDKEDYIRNAILSFHSKDDFNIASDDVKSQMLMSIRSEEFLIAKNDMDLFGKY